MRRGESGLCLVVGVDKPSGMSSHDVVNRCRRIFGERRVGHTGTLDPLASGVLPICVGPATRLDAYLTGHDKRYVVRVAFGAATDTDDAQGEVIRTSPVPDEVLDPFFAASFVSSLVGASKQLPPVYSAIKVNGRKACDEARRGNIISMEPRDIEVYAAELRGVYGADASEPPAWEIAFHVSKGTYIRSLARDIGAALGCAAHVGSLRRTSVGNLTLDECVSLETLAEVGTRAALDPVRLLGLRFAFADAAVERAVANGNQLPKDALALCERRFGPSALEMCACTAGVRESCEDVRPGELVAVVAGNKLAGIYEYDGASRRYKTRCVFQTGVSRGDL
ncbi:tRNA pseudouridine(55) synthase TruB [Adlercreutzia sp. ZJ473]|uniref:tRNA pseudouridine(55) synthase TruB n=1 Tax=Adlercreutzia sp. ZJ473 TaxID=2722822 RepID=UPI0015558908|nr:tRNA pseudouridine(55) synthase TruB [Adlercreutzia sp. ZJ473]